MPWWAVTYLVAYVALMVVGQALDLREKPRLHEWICDGLAGVILAALFVGYWFSPIHSLLGSFAVVLFIAAIGWEAYSDSQTLRKIWYDPELSRAERIGLSVVSPLFGWPCNVIAGLGLAGGVS